MQPLAHQYQLEILFGLEGIHFVEAHGKRIFFLVISRLIIDGKHLVVQLFFIHMNTVLRSLVGHPKWGSFYLSKIYP